MGPGLSSEIRERPAPHEGGVRVGTFTRWDDLEGHAAAWDALGELASGDIYGSFDWSRTWWEFYGGGRRLDVKLVWKGDELIAVWRLFHETHWLGGLPVRFVRLVGSDFGFTAGGVFIKPGAEDEAVKALAEALRQSREDWDVLHFGTFRGTVEIGRELVEAFGRHFPEADVSYDGEAGPYVVFDMPATFDEYLQKVSKGRKTTILRKARQLAREHRVEHIVREGREELEEAFPLFLESHERLWRGKGSRGYFNEWPDAKAFHARLIEKLSPARRVFMTELKVDGETAARQYCFRFGRKVHWFQPSREESPEYNQMGTGNISLFRLFEHAIATGATAVDGGGRPIDYKLELGGRLTSLKVLTVTRRGAWPAARLLLFKAGAWALNAAYAGLWYRRIAPRLAATGKPYAPAWVRSRMRLPRHSGAVTEARAD